MADTDAQLELKKRARRRLIGAVALALAAAIILPMIMDSEPRQFGNDLQIRIPSQEGSQYASRSISVAGASSSPVMLPGDPEMSPLTVSPSSSSAASVTTSAASIAAQAPAPREAVSSSVATPSAPASTSAEARARALLEQGQEPASKFFVQVGVYREVDNARSIAGKVKQLGMLPSVEKVGASTRIRVGPFKTRAEADRALASLKKAQLGGVVTGK